MLPKGKDMPHSCISTTSPQQFELFSPPADNLIDTQPAQRASLAKYKKPGSRAGLS
ncbi:hypothetical protein CUJ84_Chr001238 [Rhizobium leguminosarum]|uniref:Uncharacterized protein n=1 Tax=Rhizobium leguminosarum TaxID=384 RepID=A0A2K9Z075_RHILE|nr:hypothetical protein CUJ84_Chr001238 [Rhizobium leguminosarum]